jgi:hypothetical protein
MRLPEMSHPDADQLVLSLIPTPAPQPHEAANIFDDVWGSAPSSPATRAHDRPSIAQTHPSDIPRLQAEHNTAGYREGITVGKTQSIQAGFDEGYGLGATLGAKAGEITGILESIAMALEGYSAVDGASSADHDATADARRRLDEARRELSHDRIFSPDYWKEDGTWRYAVEGDDEANGEAVFADVASAHPLLREWTKVLEDEMRRWQLTHDVFGDAANVAAATLGGASRDVATSTERPTGGPAPAAKKALDW